MLFSRIHHLSNLQNLQRGYSSEPSCRLDAVQLWRLLSIFIEQEKLQGAGCCWHKAGTFSTVMDIRSGRAVAALCEAVWELCSSMWQGWSKAGLSTECWDWKQGQSLEESMSTLLLLPFPPSPPSLHSGCKFHQGTYYLQMGIFWKSQRQVNVQFWIDAELLKNSFFCRNHKIIFSHALLKKNK